MQQPADPLIKYLSPFLADLGLSVSYLRSRWILSNPKKVIIKTKNALEIYDSVRKEAIKQLVFFPSAQHLDAYQ